LGPEVELLDGVIGIPVRRLLAKIDRNWPRIIVVVGNMHIVVFKEFLIALARLRQGYGFLELKRVPVESLFQDTFLIAEASG